MTKQATEQKEHTFKTKQLIFRLRWTLSGCIHLTTPFAISDLCWAVFSLAWASQHWYWLSPGLGCALYSLKWAPSCLIWAHLISRWPASEFKMETVVGPTKPEFCWIWTPLIHLLTLTTSRTWNPGALDLSDGQTVLSIDKTLFQKGSVVVLF